MAFLDNSGDIILDAVLTDTGRRRMAAGNFRITKFALGDDEISYALYNKSHPSGSAYYDLEILQTPIFEAFTGTVTSAINYGLTSYARNDLLYLPSIKLNEKTFDTRIVSMNTTQNVFYLADDSRRTSAGQPTSDALGVSLGNTKANILVSAVNTSRFVLFEVGILNSDLSPTANNQSVFLSRTGLMDKNFIVSFDNRFIAGVIAASTASKFSNSGTTPLTISLAPSMQNLNDKALNNHSQTAVPAVVNRMYADYSQGASSDLSQQYSVIPGPRSVFGALSFEVRPDLGTSIYRRWGTLNTIMISGDSTNQLYDFIDTTIYVRGLTSNVVLQLPIRVVRISDNT